MIRIGWFTRGVGVLLSGLGVLLGSGLAAAQGPKAVVPEMVHDFESVVEGAVVRHDFVIRNEGTGELVIENVKAG